MYDLRRDAFAEHFLQNPVLDTPRRAPLVFRVPGTHQNMKNELISLITNKQAHVGVIGLGYVGLPLLVEFASKGFRGTGFEVDETKADANQCGQFLHRRRAVVDE